MTLFAPSVAGKDPAFTVPHLNQNEVHIWRLEPETAANLQHYAALLNPDEKSRADRFRFPHLTESFIADHGRLRLILGRYAQAAPETLAFSVNAFGKPRLVFPSTPLQFNLSHTKGLTLLAISHAEELGIDVEAVRSLDDLELIAASHFSPQENAALLRFPEAERTQAFFRCWTRKEAFIKARGEGLSLGLDRFSVSLDPRSATLLHCAWDDEEAARWSLTPLPAGEQFAAALAIRHHGWNIHHFNFAGPL